MSRLFDIEEVQWTQDGPGTRYCVFRASDLATVQYYELAPGASTPQICAPVEILALCEHGICDYIIDGVTYTVDDGSWCHIPEGMTYQVRNHEGSTAVQIRYHLPAWDALPESPKVCDRGHGW